MLVALVAAGGLAWRASDDGEATSVRTSGQVAEFADGPSEGGALDTTASDPATPPSPATPGYADRPGTGGNGAADDDDFVTAGRGPTTTTTEPATSTTSPSPEPDGTPTTTGPAATTSTTRGSRPPTSGPPSTRPPTTTTTEPTTTTTTAPGPVDPGGRILVYSKEVGPQQVRLFIGHVDGSHERPLTSGSNDQFPAWSPDGSTIVFTRYDSNGYSQLWTIRPDGSGLRQLTTSGPEDKRDAAWSPDGRFLAFTGFYKTTYPYQWSVRIVVLELATGVMTDVSAGHFDSTPVWSPDSTTLVYRTLSPSREDYELWRVTRQGTDRRPVISAPGTSSPSVPTAPAASRS